jgi:histidinol dehydrogenase
MMIPILEGKDVQAYVEMTVKGLSNAQAQAQQLATTHAVERIIEEVITRGDTALYDLAQRFNDALAPNEPIALSEKDWASACQRIPQDVKASLEEAVANIRLFGETMMDALPKEARLYEHHGYKTGFVLRPVVKVACYVPAGRYPLVSSAMMTAITARVAGVKELVLLCANPADEILYVAQLAGVHSVYKIGGAQALAAVAYGTTQVPKMDMVVGPGNRFVVEAKRQLNGRIGIDSLAGPSEALLIVDETANLSFVASDLLGQAEHDPDARITLLTHDAQVAHALQAELESALKLLDLPAFVKASSLKNSVILITKDLEASIKIANQLAPEHLHLHGKAVEARQGDLTHYGTLFVGEYATIAHGDYCAGPNHTLPTSGSARFSSSLSPMTFLRVQNILNVPASNSYLNELTANLANLEHLTAHAYSALIREED